MGRYSTLHIFEPRFTDSGVIKYILLNLPNISSNNIVKYGKYASSI